MSAEPSELYGWVLATAGEFPRFRGDPERALALKERAVAVLEGLDVTPQVTDMLAATLSDASDVLTRLDDLERAQDYADRALQLRRDAGDVRGIAHALEAVALVAERRRMPSRALSLYDEAVSLLEQTENFLEASFPLVGVSRARLALGEFGAARAAAEEAVRRSGSSGDSAARVHALAALGFVAAEEEDREEAVRLLAQARAEADDGGLVLEVTSEVDLVLDACRADLPDERFAAAVDAGLDAAASSLLLD